MKNIPLDSIPHTHIVAASFEPGDGGWFSYELLRKTPQGWLLEATQSAEYPDWPWYFPDHIITSDDWGEILDYRPLSEAEYLLYLITVRMDIHCNIWKRKKATLIQESVWFPEG